LWSNSARFRALICGYSLTHSGHHGRNPSSVTSTGDGTLPGPDRRARSGAGGAAVRLSSICRRIEVLEDLTHASAPIRRVMLAVGHLEVVQIVTKHPAFRDQRIPQGLIEHEIAHRQAALVRAYVEPDAKRNLCGQRGRAALLATKLQNSGTMDQPVAMDPD